jgi:hypothetical protein
VTAFVAGKCSAPFGHFHRISAIVFQPKRGLVVREVCQIERSQITDSAACYLGAPGARDGQGFGKPDEHRWAYEQRLSIRMASDSW